MSIHRPRVGGGVELVDDRDAARAFLQRDRAWAAWALCISGRDDWPRVHFWRDRTTGAALWVLDHPRWGGAVHTFWTGPGGTDPSAAGAGLDAVVRAALLPRRAFLKLLPDARASLEVRYRLDRLEPIVRMHVTPATFRPPDGAPPSEPLGPEHGAELARLYAGWPEAGFGAGRLHRGYRYRGIRQDGELVAVAEHVLRSPERDMAIVQGVYVEPRWRGRGLARAVTAGLTAQLFAEGARDVVLDVRVGNRAAIAAYARLGYRRWGQFLGGPADLR